MNKLKDNSFKMIWMFFLIMILIGLIFRHIYYKTEINSERINFITPKNDKQAYHPKVISFDKKWNGYKYWVAFTPYPKADETEENPVINASNDMVTWYEPNNIKNPLDVPTPSDSQHYNSDTHLLYNENLNQLEIFWRYVNDKDNSVIIYKRTSKDGSNWTEKEVFLVSNNRKNNDWVSPAIILEDNTYKIWYVAKREIYYIEKTGEFISEPILIDVNYKDNHRTWHIDVMYNESKNIYELVTVAYVDVNNRENMEMFYSSSKDNISWSTAIKILSPSIDKSAWDSQGLYRGSLIYIDNKYYIFYSGHDKDMNVGVGLMCGKNIEKLNSCS